MADRLTSEEEALTRARPSEQRGERARIWATLDAVRAERDWLLLYLENIAESENTLAEPLRRHARTALGRVAMSDEERQVLVSSKLGWPHIETPDDFERYKQEVERGLDGLSFVSTGEHVGFSWSPCDCCNRDLGGDRWEARGRDSENQLIELLVCTDCVYYIEYGELYTGG